MYINGPSSVILTIVVLYLWNSVPMAGAQILHILFYILSFIRYATLPFLVMVFVPLCTQLNWWCLTLVVCGIKTAVYKTMAVIY